jgi:peptide/nickel transport system ATP-binding protein
MTTTPLLEVKDLHVRFVQHRALWAQGTTTVDAVRGVSFTIERGQAYGLVGESGSGKTTIGRTILGLAQPTSGTIRFDGEPLFDARGRLRSTRRRAVQAVFQDPYSSLNPTMTIGRLLAEAVRRYTDLDRSDTQRRVAELLEAVGLSPSHANRLPIELSGGQRQRVNVARALAVDPELIVCDEPTSALDVSTQAQVLNLLADLRSEFDVSYLFISHDLAVIEHIADSIGVLYAGTLLESGPPERVVANPAHPYTQLLVSSAPVPEPTEQHHRRSRLNELLRATGANGGENGASAHGGCPFAPRCPFVFDPCREELPDLTPVQGGGEVRCYLQTHGPTLAGRSVVGLPLPVPVTNQRS